MFRKLIFITLSLTLAIGISSATFSDSQPKPTKKAAKKTKAKKSKDDDSKPAAAVAEKITWYSMTDGFAKAKKENKILVVDVFTDWCYWCKVMDKLTYENKNIVTKMKKYAVAVKFNPEVNANHTVNGQVMSSDQLATYLNRGGRIPGYPMTFVWKDLSNSSKIEPYSGYLDTTTFNAVLNKTIQE
ncbi:MAG: thioredoxin family protein [Chitinophagaceae bacterium]